MLYAIHNKENLRRIEQSCNFYLPKVNNYEEALFWERLLSKLEDLVHLPRYSFKVSVIIESLTAVLEVEEIIFALG